MATTSFTVAFPAADVDVAADAMAAVFNNSANPTTYVAVCEVRTTPLAINDDTTNILGNQGILSLDRISAASGGTELSPAKFDTNAGALPSTIKLRDKPTSVTLSGGTIRRFGDCISSFSITKAMPFRTIRAPGVVDCNDHSGRTAEGRDIWRADGISDTEPIVLREGEGIAIVKRAWGIPQSMRLAITVVISTKTYHWSDSAFGTPMGLDSALVSLMNETGSGLIVYVYVASMPDMGEENIPRYRLVKCENVFDVISGTSVTPAVHDTASSVGDVSCYVGPMRIKPWAAGEGAQAKYHDYQSTPVTTAEMQKVDTIRIWGGAGPYIRTTSSPLINWDVLGRSEPEVWPGDRRGVGGGLDFPIVLRPGQGLAVIGGGNGVIETSEQAYLMLEMCGYVYTATAVYPIENDVRNGVDYGPTGTEYDGDLVLPAEADVKDGVFYGADGTEYEGEYTGGGGGGMSRSRVVNT
jgi:hypothetical protein